MAPFPDLSALDAAIPPAALALVQRQVEDKRCIGELSRKLSAAQRERPPSPPPLRLAHLRKALGGTKKGMARDMGTSAALLSRMEKKGANMLVRGLQKYAAALGGELTVTVTLPGGVETEVADFSSRPPLPAPQNTAPPAEALARFFALPPPARRWVEEYTLQASHDLARVEKLHAALDVAMQERAGAARRVERPLATLRDLRLAAGRDISAVAAHTGMDFHTAQGLEEGRRAANAGILLRYVAGLGGRCRFIFSMPGRGETEISGIARRPRPAAPVKAPARPPEFLDALRAIPPSRRDEVLGRMALALDVMESLPPSSRMTLRALRGEKGVPLPRLAGRARRPASGIAQTERAPWRSRLAEVEALVTGLGGTLVPLAVLPGGGEAIISGLSLSFNRAALPGGPASPQTPLCDEERLQTVFSALGKADRETVGGAISGLRALCGGHEAAPRRDWPSMPGHTLKTLRAAAGKTRVALAAAGVLPKSTMAFMELPGANPEMHNLARYVRGCGAELHMLAVFPDGRAAPLADFDGPAPGRRRAARALARRPGPG